MDRRRFLQVLGTSSTAATAAGCSSKSGEKLIPYLVPVEELTPGVSSEFATVCRECPAGCGMVARVRDGRAHKVEGNPDHPLNQGTLCLRGQASLQGLYHPDRIRGPLARDAHGRLQPISWAEAELRLDAALQKGAGRAAWIGRLETGALDSLIGRWLNAAAGGGTHLRYEPFAYEPLRAAAGRVLGRPEIPDFRLQAARMLVSFGAEFVETWISNVEYSRAFSAWRQARVAGKHQGRYVFLSPRLSLTGANADEWVPIRPGSEAQAAEALLRAVQEEAGSARSASLGALAAAAGLQPELLQRLARELRDQSPSLVLPVGIAGHSPGAVAACEAVLRLNQELGNVGHTLLMGRPHALSTAASQAELVALVDRMRAGEVGVLFLHHANPAYHLPPAVGFAEALARVPVVVSFSSHLDETTALASVVLPDHTPLESWGEYSPRPGVTGLLQPVVSPTFDTRSTGDVLLASARRLGHDLGAAEFQSYLRNAHAAAEAEWQQAVGRGGYFATADRTGLGPGGRELAIPSVSGPAGTTAPAPATARPAAAPAAPDRPTPAPAEGLLLVLYPSLHFYDGRTANRSWAQEIPDPVAKAVWGSWAEIHPDTARRLNVRNDDLLQLSTEAGRLDVPALVTDRVHPEGVAVQLGQGHTQYGRYAAGTGVNPLPLLPRQTGPAGELLCAGVPVQVTRLAVRRALPVLQTSQRQLGPEVARELTLAELAGRHDEDPKAREEERSPSLYRNQPQGEHRWGMVIDLDRCVGCNACVAACYAENNVPIVGKEECGRGREMAWLRIENYVGERPHEGAAPRPWSNTEPRDAAPLGVGELQPDGAVRLDVRFLPMLCQQCNNAPCEYVCPVNATMHSSDGLNQQIYNRCVGTRFCSNNCPYKVRRFNWFTYPFPEPLDLQLNPDVLRRTKGVMEKCTFCVQRIRRARIDAKADARAIRDGELMTACQQTCPTDAIVFGDLQDPNSRVSQLAKDPRGYGALSELNTYPNVTYLARVRAE